MVISASSLTLPGRSAMGAPEIMRLLSDLLFGLAIFVGGGAILIYGFLTSVACGYAPGGSGCRALPWELGDDERFLLVGLPTLIVVALLALAGLARKKARQSRD
jgi:Mn2+/Fe2+ NRAMP family transporter